MISRDFEITLRIPEFAHIPNCFKVVQNDKDVYNLIVHITDGISEINYSDVSSATITFSKVDGTVVQGDMIVGANALTYTMGTTEISCPGKVTASIQLFGEDGERLTTARFRFEVVADLITPGAVQSESRFPLLQQLVADVEQLKQDIVDLQIPDNSIMDEKLSDAAGQIKQRFATHMAENTTEHENFESQLAEKANQSDLEIERARITNLSTLTAGSTTGDAELIDARVGADGVTYTNVGGAIRGQVSELKEDLAKWTRLDGVTIKDGTDLSPLIVESGEKGYYVNNGTILPISYNDYRYFKIPVDGGSKYYFDKSCRWVFSTDMDGNVVDTTDATNIDYFTTTSNAVLLWCTYNTTEQNYRKIAKGSTPTSTIYELPQNVKSKGVDALQTEVDALQTEVDALGGSISKGVVSKTGTFSVSGNYILLSNARSNLRKGIRLVFESTVTSGTDFEVGFSISEVSVYGQHNVVGVTSTNVSYNNVNYSHGLTISGRVQLIFEYLDNATADITLICNGNRFKQNIPFVMSSVAVPYVKSNGLIASDCKLTFICTDIRKKIWMFGDTYADNSPYLWTYYLKEYGYDRNVLIDGWAGMGSVNARVSFAKLVNLGKPQYAVWFMGMNDGSDADDNTPSTTWATERDVFISICSQNGITPIFATIPNVPTINHNGKNNWIKSSGYRYIDMCHSVGADVDTGWYGDMISSDNIHPSESGAKALFAQVLLDLPEVMLDNL